MSLLCLELFAVTRSIGKAPRGSRTGTQGIKGAKDRAIIPDALCEYIVELCEAV